MASAAILAGGAARRFNGRDKSAIMVDGRTILDRQLQALKPLTDDIMIVGRRDTIHPALRSIGDLRPGLGPLSGLESALVAARDESLLLLACDLPFLTTGLLAHLLSLAPTADAVVPLDNRGYHPLCAVYDRRCLGTVRRHLDQRELALKGLLSVVSVTTVESAELARFGPEGQLLANVNTAADLNEIETFLNHEL